MILLIISLLLSQSFAWHDLGHMTVATIAEIHLKKSSLGTEAWQWATDILTPFSDYCGEENHPFVEAATWPDKIKEQGWYTMSNWHFSNFKLATPGFTVPDTNKTNEDILYAIYHDFKFIASAKEDVTGKSKSILGRSLELRNFIHWFGDIHQPLHVSQRFSEKTPNGD